MRRECHRYETCNAPLCPLGEKHYIWYPDEEICTYRKFSREPWIKAQRKIAKRTANPDRYFTFAMLNQGCVIRTGIIGLDPDAVTSRKELEKKWLKNHPPKREISDKEKQWRKKRLEANLRGRIYRTERQI